MIIANGKNIEMFQGDTGNLIFSGIPTDKTYSVYMSLYDTGNNKIKFEFQPVTSDTTTGKATFTVSSAVSDTLPVGEWTYAVKICASGSEDTIVPETKLVDGEYVTQDAPYFNVNPKRVEGTV